MPDIDYFSLIVRLAGKVTAPEGQCVNFTVTEVQFAPREAGICESWVEVRTDMSVPVAEQ